MEPALANRRILVGVSGGIAAYKAAELVRLLVKAGAEVRVVMTPAATKFITPLTLQALSQHPVATDTFDLTQEATIGHIELADWAELLVVAPASADVIARLALGLANDLLTTIALACKAPRVIAPAMNVNMWNHVAVQHNLQTLVARGARSVGPGVGELACGWVGSGRMVEPPEIERACAEALGPRDWQGLAVLVSAGPTHEAIDPVRFLGNRSSGKMGFAVARAAARRGARVTLVAGPTALATPPGVERVDVESARQLRDAIVERVDGAQAVVMAAAVADYRPRAAATGKLKKAALGGAPALELELNPDILAELGARSYARRPVLVGFAAETAEVERHAVEKLCAKKCDLMVANDVGEPGSGFGTETNRVILVGADGTVERLPMMSKAEVAERILDRARALVVDER
ncbi:MAG TPA: bifunctional phosphopantothenoylcysteine decarboxylase/phosphopantothenate--cysteine ligase CoaBC [Polyangia bacterium]|nr:bifunctional phosphopantothenoylcysteine decarboxylase/phosphopantothenate--cysteine ligase CoaBC [Polyangia bacterium]